MRQLVLDFALPAAPPFAAFLAGADAAFVQDLRTRPWPGAPLYLWGPAGSGKTHLLRELARRAAAEGRVAQWFDARTAPPWTMRDDAELLLLDDAGQWSQAQQHAAFALFAEAAGRVPPDGPAASPDLRLGLQFASAGRLPPVDLPLREDLRSRLGWGTVHALRPLAEPDVRVALRQEALRRGLALGDEVIDYLLTRFARDLKTLMRLLHQLDGHALAEKRAITLPLLKHMLDQERDAA